jgi:hypothetical protein
MPIETRKSTLRSLLRGKHAGIKLNPPQPPVLTIG